MLCSAGGGGNSKDRKDKIEAKNKKLFEERQRNAKEIQKEKKRLEQVEETGVDDYAHIHPSRRPRMA
jgi:nucleolar protein 6